MVLHAWTRINVKALQQAYIFPGMAEINFRLPFLGLITRVPS
jgi:hypothetical protein